MWLCSFQSEDGVRPYVSLFAHAYYMATPIILALTNPGLRVVLVFQVLTCRCTGPKGFVEEVREATRKMHVYKSENISGMFVMGLLRRRSQDVKVRTSTSSSPSSKASTRSSERGGPKKGASAPPGTSTSHAKARGRVGSAWNRIDLAKVRALPRRLCRRSLSASNCLLIGAKFGRKDLFKF